MKIEDRLEKFKEWLYANEPTKGEIMQRVESLIAKQRTSPQNRALHKGFSLLAEALNDAGYSVQKLLKVDVDWTTGSVKDYIWRPFQRGHLQKESTTDLEKLGEIDEVWKLMMRELGEKKHIDYIPFPSYETDYEKAPLINDKKMRT